MTNDDAERAWSSWFSETLVDPPRGEHHVFIAGYRAAEKPLYQRIEALVKATTARRTIDRETQERIETYQMTPADFDDYLAQANAINEAIDGALAVLAELR